MTVMRGSAFLWHQVRCMMAVLFLIVNEEEPVEITKKVVPMKEGEEEYLIDDLLDQNLLYSRLNYDSAEGMNLILSECGFKDIFC